MWYVSVKGVGRIGDVRDEPWSKREVGATDERGRKDVLVDPSERRARIREAGRTERETGWLPDRPEDDGAAGLRRLLRARAARSRDGEERDGDRRC